MRIRDIDIDDCYGYGQTISRGVLEVSAKTSAHFTDFSHTGVGSHSIRNLHGFLRPQTTDGWRCGPTFLLL